jgi:glutamate-1-semialdehyde 2,1-aminomutase
MGAFGSSAEVMARLAPLGPVYQAGTLSGNPLATAAGLAVLDALDDAAYVRLEATAAALATGLRLAFDAAGVDVVVPRFGPLVGIFFGHDAPLDFEGAAVSVAAGRYPEFFHGMLDRGVALAPGPYEVMFPSLAHTDEDLELVIDAAHTVAAGMAGA